MTFGLDIRWLTSFFVLYLRCFNCVKSIRPTLVGQDKRKRSEATRLPTFSFFGSGGRIRTDDLRVMSASRRAG